MNGNGADRIINPEPLVDNLNRENNHNTCNDTDNKSTRHTDQVTAGRYCNETCEGTVKRHRDIRLAVTNPRNNHDSSCSRGRSHVSRNKNCCGRNKSIITRH